MEYKTIRQQWLEFFARGAPARKEGGQLGASGAKLFKHAPCKNKAKRLCADCNADISHRRTNAKRCEGCAYKRSLAITRVCVRAWRARKKQEGTL